MAMPEDALEQGDDALTETALPRRLSSLRASTRSPLPLVAGVNGAQTRPACWLCTPQKARRDSTRGALKCYKRRA